MNKTKVIIFNSRKTHGHSFTLGDTALEVVTQYLYLGIVFTPSGTFNSAFKLLKSKAQKAVFAMRKYIDNKTSIQIQLKLFRSLIQPILLYGSEVWGPYIGGFKKDSNNLPRICGDDQWAIETVHIKYLKTILGVHKRSCNIAVRAELGAYPMCITVFSNVMTYYSRLEAAHQHSLLNQCLIMHSRMDSMQDNKQNIIHFVNSIGQAITVSRIQILNVNKKDTSIKLKRLYNGYFKETLQANAKLLVYKKIKLNFDLESYLTRIHDQRKRRAITNMRISAHNLMIEKGRYHKPLPIKQEDRICPICKTGLGDELHLLFKCNHEEMIIMRHTFIQNILPIKRDLNQFPIKEQFYYLLSCKDHDTTPIVADYVWRSQLLYNKIIDNPSA
jgi:hypothetical protein